MSDALESRMSAMRARLSNLSHTVEQQDEAHHQRRHALAHRYCTDAEQVHNAAVESGNTHQTAREVPSALTLASGLRERDINVPAPSSAKLGGALTRNANIRSSSTPATATGAEATKPAMRVNTMLQLARQHAPAPTTSDAVHSHAAAVPRAAAPSVAAVTNGLVAHKSVTAAPTSPVMIPGGFPGLHAYGFQERFPTPRRREEAHPVRGTSLVEPHVPVARTPYTGTHAAPTTLYMAQPTSQNAPLPLVQRGTEASEEDDSGEVSFDAFRVVQERLRQKMRQLTSNPAPAPLSKTTDDVHIPRPDKNPVPLHTETDDLEDTSPPPRLPPSHRAETATPTRSESANTEAVSESSATADSPHDTVAPRAAEARGVPGRVDYGEASMEVEVLPNAAPQETHRSLYSAAVDDAVSETSDVPSAHVPPPPVTAARPVVPRAPPQGAFSNPTSQVAAAAPERYRDPLPSWPECPRGYGSAAPTSKATMRRSGSGGRGGASGHRAAAPSRGSHAASGGPRCRSLTSSQRNGTPSASAPRSSVTREGSGSRRSAHQTTAARPKPISLNVEATILCAVTGAELLALLRMRGLIESDGDTEEYRLPPVRCHRLYVTAEEHRQLQLLRQSLHAMAVEEQRQEAPSYQRATVSARSRNAEFVPPPQVSRYMGA